MSENITTQMLDSLLSQAQPLPSYVGSTDYVDGFNNAILYVRNLLSDLREKVGDNISVSDKIINDLNTGLRVIVNSHVGEFASSSLLQRINCEVDNLVEDTFDKYGFYYRQRGQDIAQLVYLKENSSFTSFVNNSVIKKIVEG